MKTDTSLTTVRVEISQTDLGVLGYTIYEDENGDEKRINTSDAYKKLMVDDAVYNPMDGVVSVLDHYTLEKMRSRLVDQGKSFRQLQDSLAVAAFVKTAANVVVAGKTVKLGGAFAELAKDKDYIEWLVNTLRVITL